MDFLGGALPNIMFIVGIIAIGIGLGIEFKIVEIKREINKGGRIASFSIGVALIAASIFLYTRSSRFANAPTAPTVEQPTSVQTDANSAASASTQVAISIPTPPPASTPPEITTAAIVTPPPTPITDPMADMQALLTAGIADGRVGKGVKDLLKNWQEAQDALSKGDQKRAGDRLRDLQKELQQAADKDKIDPLFVQEALDGIQRIATQYGLDVPSVKP
ncbi:MAG: hypothetical protein HYR94_02285 [Chloroflexi bacterium]|nr:hypothetical protein [Chloroflexota bacterium]